MVPEDQRRSRRTNRERIKTKKDFIFKSMPIPGGEKQKKRMERKAFITLDCCRPLSQHLRTLWRGGRWGMKLSLFILAWEHVFPAVRVSSLMLLLKFSSASAGLSVLFCRRNTFFTAQNKNLPDEIPEVKFVLISFFKVTCNLLLFPRPKQLSYLGLLPWLLEI